MSPQQTAQPAAPAFDPSQNYQGANAGPAAFDPGGSYQAAQPATKPADQGTLSKVWDWANKGLISGKTLLNVVGDIMPRSPDMNPGETATEFLDRVQNHIDPEHPYLNALKVGMAGVDKDVAKTISAFSSPLSIALMGTGAATKIPGAVGTVAKAVTGLTGAGIATKGVSDIAEPTGNSPEAWQQRLQGGAEVAGGAAAAAPAAVELGSKALLLGKTPAEAYQSALKPSTTIAPAKVARIVQTGLENEIPVSKAGAEKLSSLLEDLQDKVTQEIGSGQGKTVDPQAVAQRVDAVKGRFANQVNPTGDLAAIDASKQEFLANNPNPIPAADAQAMKVGTYQQLKGKAYGELKSASIEAQKALARGLKEELTAQFPELGNLNAAESKIYDMQPILEKAIQRQGNHQIMGIGTPIVTGATKAVTGSSTLAAVAGAVKAIVDNPIVKSRLAIALNKTGVPHQLAISRVEAYSAALAAAASSAKQSTDDDRTNPPSQ